MFSEISDFLNQYFDKNIVIFLTIFFFLFWNLLPRIFRFRIEKSQTKLNNLGKVVKDNVFGGIVSMNIKNRYEAEMYKVSESIYIIDPIKREIHASLTMRLTSSDLYSNDLKNSNRFLKYDVDNRTCEVVAPIPKWLNTILTALLSAGMSVSLSIVITTLITDYLDLNTRFIVGVIGFAFLVFSVAGLYITRDIDSANRVYKAIKKLEKT